MYCLLLILKLYGTIHRTILKTRLVKSKNHKTPWGLVLESGTKLTVRASAITTTRKIARLRASLGPWRKVFKKEKSRSYTYLHYT